MRKYENVTGKKFGRLIPLKHVGIKNGGTKWLCLCDCGNKKDIYISHMKSGRISSCGCLNSEKVISRNTKHNNAIRTKHTRSYSTWQSMKTRCDNPNHPKYHLWGGRGIKICKRWYKFENFLEDMGQRPIRTTLDRINNNGNYCKSNCRWATPKEQNNNKRNNKKL